MWPVKNFLEQFFLTSIIMIFELRGIIFKRKCFFLEISENFNEWSMHKF